MRVISEKLDHNVNKISCYSINNINFEKYGNFHIIQASIYLKNERCDFRKDNLISIL